MKYEGKVVECLCKAKGCIEIYFADNTYIEILIADGELVLVESALTSDVVPIGANTLGEARV